MNVTLICDASYCDRYKVAGYGFWIACERGKIGGSGRMFVDVENNNTAEMMAICNTIWRGIAEGVIHHSDVLLIQSDCLSAMEKMTGVQKPVTEQEQAVVGYYEKTVARNNLTVSFRHVRGHTVRTEPRYVANRMCDTRAKSEMRAARKEKVLITTKQEVDEILERAK